MTFYINRAAIRIVDKTIKISYYGFIDTKKEYGNVSNKILSYLVNEGFFLTPECAARWNTYFPDTANVTDLKNMFLDKVVDWKMELYDCNGKLVLKDKCVV